MTTPGRSAGATLAVLLFAAGVAALAAARLTGPIAAGDAALAAGQWERAAAAYADAEARLGRRPAIRQLLARDYDRVVANQLWLDYRRQRLDDLLARAERAPEAAAPHFWAGLALLARARAEEQPDAQLELLTSAEEELRAAVAADPADWDAKYDFELVTRLLAARRQQPKAPPSQLLQLLRPPPQTAAQPGRRVG